MWASYGLNSGNRGKFVGMEAGSGKRRAEGGGRRGGGRKSTKEKRCLGISRTISVRLFFECFASTSSSN